MIIRAIAPGAALQLALTDDVHHAPLPPLDRARFYAHLTRELRLPIAEVAAGLGKSVPEIETKLEYLSFDYEMIESLETGRLSEAQADVLVSLADEGLRRRLWRNTVRRDWSPDPMRAAAARWTAPAEAS